MTTRSNLDVAYDIVSSVNGSISFNDLWVKVCEVQGYPQNEMEGKIGKFYTNLLLDGRFVNLGDNVWDLRERNTFDKVHIDMEDCYTEDEADIDPEELAEEKAEEKALGDDEEEEDSESSKYEPEEEA